jgi:hypothetical protein
MKSFFKRNENYKTLREKCVGYKKPTKKCKDKFVGLELEIITKVPREILIWEFNKAGLAKYIVVGEDFSIKKEKGFPYTAEVRVLCKQKELSKIVNQVTKVLKVNGSAVNQSCGLHVHLDMRNRKVSTAYTNLVNNLTVLTKLVNKSRYEKGSYNKLNKNKDFVTSLKGKFIKIPSQSMNYDVVPHKPMVDSNGNPIMYMRSICQIKPLDRNSAINPYAYKEHKTLECRLHEGTIEASKIIRWVNKLVKIADSKVA